MTEHLLKRLHIAATLLVFAISSNAQIPVFNSVTSNTTTPAKFEKFELNINLTAGYTNAYDYDDIAVQCVFTSPSARKDTVDGFFMQDYTLDGNNNLTPSGAGDFKVRYAPNETGLWSYTLSCKNLSGTTIQPAQAFQCGSSSSAGFIRRNTTNYLSFDDGSQYIAIGENMGWQAGNVVTDYTNWLTKLADNGGNFIRVWMASWSFALEWKNGNDNFQGLKKYKQSNAFYLDWLLDYCRQKKVYPMLALNNHGQVSTNVNPQWSDNPYNAENGGPANNTWDFFTNATARALHKNRLRYIIARYGYSQNIQSWELFNELHWTNNFEEHKTEITAWDDEMSAYIKNKDVYKHLVTTSYGGTEISTNTWSLPNIDFTQTHFYINSSNIETALSAGNQSFLSQYSKPTLNGEFGLGPSGTTLTADDPGGVHIHNAIWGSMFSGGLGSGMTWWWDDYINPQNLYYHFKPLASVVSLINFKKDDYKKVAASTSGGGVADLIISPGVSWAASTSASFTIDSSGNISPGVNQLGQFLYGSQWNTQYRNPPTFNVTYPVNGQFKVITGSSLGQDAHITIYVDGVQQLDQVATINSTYSVNVTASPHAIKVDNLGTDWANIFSYVFTNIGSPLSSYVLKSANNFKASGWALNNQYNWQYLKNNGNAAPPAVTGSSISIPGMQNGIYKVRFYNTSSGNLISSLNVQVNNGQLKIVMPDIAWDIAFTAAKNSLLSTRPIRSFSFPRDFIIYPNPFKNYIIIRAKAGKTNVQITDQMGRLTLNKLMNSNNSQEMKLPLTALRPGAYFLKITDEHGVLLANEKIVK